MNITINFENFEKNILYIKIYFLNIIICKFFIKKENNHLVIMEQIIYKKQTK